MLVAEKQPSPHSSSASSQPAPTGAPGTPAASASVHNHNAVIGAVVGSVIGGLVLICIVVATIVVTRRRHARTQQDRIREKLEFTAVPFSIDVDQIVPNGHPHPPSAASSPPTSEKVGVLEPQLLVQEPRTAGQPSNPHSNPPTNYSAETDISVPALLARLTDLISGLPRGANLNEAPPQYDERG